MTNEILTVDVAIVGAGPAGLAAARATARSGCTVAIVDDNPRAGGQVWRHGPH
ncbi:FAD-dependent oxidoreductase, partial [Burkholderia pseudomallei]